MKHPFIEGGEVRLLSIKPSYSSVNIRSKQQGLSPRDASARV